EQRLHAKGPRFVRYDRHDELAHLRITQHFAQHANVGHGGGDFPALAAVVKFLEEFVVVGYERLRAYTPLRYVTAQGFPTRAQILNLDAVFRRAIEWNFDAVLIVKRNAEARTKNLQLLFIQFFLLVGNVLAFAGFAQTVSLNRARKDDGRSALELDRGFVSRVNLAWIVPAETQTAQRFVRKRLDQVP